MVSGGVLVIWQGDMLVGLPGGPSPFLRIPHQSYLVTPMQWVVWAAVKIKIVYVWCKSNCAKRLFHIMKIAVKMGYPNFHL
jgi:hypothetical protein